MSQTVKIIQLAQARNSPAIIARALNIKPQAVYDALKHARRGGMDIPNFTPGRIENPTKMIEVPRVTAQKLKPEAERRGMTVEELIPAILATIANQNLVGTVIGEPNYD